MSFTKSKIASFRKVVLQHARTYGRDDLPWRMTTDPYRIFISEVMLQQTQVDRVRPYYVAWMRQFPSVQTLATASLAEVVRAWQGLGYNRRAKMVHKAAQAVVQQYKGVFPTSVHELEALPGIGSYTANAIMAFAYNAEKVICIETNIRTAVIHYFFPRTKVVSDAQIRTILIAAVPKGKSRVWYAALMDYGAHLKRNGVQVNSKTKGYTKQSVFRGSDREARGAILRFLRHTPQTKQKIIAILGDDRAAQVEKQLEKLVAEGFIEYRARRFELAR